MSYLSASENVGFSGITQNISETSCASQYKMAVESVPGTCNSDVNMFINDSSGDEQAYVPHLSDNFFHSKYKIDPNDLYTFNDCDVIAGEITVSNTEENSNLSENEVKTKSLEIPIKEFDILEVYNNDKNKEKVKQSVSNGHFRPNIVHKVGNKAVDIKKTANAKVKKVQNQNCTSHPKITVIQQPGVPSSRGPISQTHKILQVQNNVSNGKVPLVDTKNEGETFLDVFKREHILPESQMEINKTEPVKMSTQAPQAPKKAAVKPSSRVKKGRGPTQHEALQRISTRHKVTVQHIKSWQSPNEELFECGPLDVINTNPYKLLESSSSDDDNIPHYESGAGPVCVEESAAESRGARLELRRAAMRRQVARTATALHLTKKNVQHRSLAALIKKQLSSSNSSCRLPQQTINHLLAMRGMSATLLIQEKRKLRADGWSGGESSKIDLNASNICAEEKCCSSPLPCARYCLSHITLAPDQRLYAACAAVFADGERCKQPLLPLLEQTPLCAEHAWKRDNYELLSRDKPQKSRKRVWASGRAVRPPRPPRKPKRRRRLVAKRPPVHTQSLSEINAYSNSSAYDSEDTGIGGLSDGEYIGGTSTELEVGQVPSDDILDPNVLSQMPDEAFTEFFNQAEGGTFAESCELAAALEAVLDERALDMPDCVFAHSPMPANKMQVAVSMESSAPS